jgi:hypothetical protein
MNPHALQPSRKSLAMAQIAVAALSHDQLAAHGVTLDASDLTVAFARQFEFIDSEVIRGDYQPTEAEELVHFVPAGGPGVEIVTYQSVTELGRAEIIMDGSTTIPLVDAVGAEMSRKVRNLADAWQIDIFDLLRSATNPTIQIDVEKKEAAFNAIRRLHEELCMQGDSRLGWTGMINDATIPLVTQVTGTAWLSATAIEMVDDVNKLTWSIVQASKNLYKGKVFTLLVPLLLGQALDKPIGTDANKTVRSFILANSAHVAEIRHTPWLDTANAAGTGPRVMAYKKDKGVMRYGQNAQFMEKKPQEIDLNIKTPCVGRSSGLHVLRPLGAAYMDVD